MPQEDSSHHPILSTMPQDALNTSTLNDSAMQFVEDLGTFLRNIGAQREIKLSKVNWTLPLKQMLEMEKQFAKIFKPTLTPKQAYHLEIHFLMVACQALTILRVDEPNCVVLTPYGREFLQLPKWKQFGLCLQAFWFDIAWEDLMPKQSWNRGEDRTQDQSVCMAEILFNATAEEDFAYGSFWGIQNGIGVQRLLSGDPSISRVPIAEEQIYSGGVWVQKIMPLLAYLGLVEVKVTFPTSPIEAARDPVIINQLRITEFGHGLFGILTRMEEDFFHDNEESDEEFDEEDKNSDE